MDVHIDSRVSLPVYVQLADQVKYLIQSGQLESGARLPSPTHLARNLRINKHTIVKAYQELERGRYIVTYNGRGSYVADAPRSAPSAPRRMKANNSRPVPYGGGGATASSRASHS